MRRPQLEDVLGPARQQIWSEAQLSPDPRLQQPHWSLWSNGLCQGSLCPSCWLMVSLVVLFCFSWLSYEVVASGTLSLICVRLRCEDLGITIPQTPPAAPAVGSQAKCPSLRLVDQCVLGPQGTNCVPVWVLDHGHPLSAPLQRPLGTFVLSCKASFNHFHELKLWGTW